MFGSLNQALTRTRKQIAQHFSDLFLGKKEMDAEVLDRLEETLIAADIGIETAQVLLTDLREAVDRKEIKDYPTLKRRLRNLLAGMIGDSGRRLDTSNHKPFVILVIGVNGVGKTTTIAKLAHRFQKEGRSVLLAAGDTFRAAAIEQLDLWGKRLNVPVVQHQRGADPSAVLFDAVAAASTRGVDIVIADTAGRLHTKSNLMEEMKKMKRVMDKALPGSPHEILLVMDATLGQNALIQARQFSEAVGVTGIALTKLDGTAKGGVVVSIARELAIPIRYIGVGEGLDDLEAFSAEAFAEGFFD